MESLYIPEPLLTFKNGQMLESPKDGLFLFGPLENNNGRSEIQLGVIGTDSGIGLSRLWLSRLAGWIPGKADKDGNSVSWAPAWPGFEACFGVALPEKGMAELIVDKNAIENAIKKDIRADAVRSAVKLFADRIRSYLREEEKHPDVWLVVVPDVVYRYGRPDVALPPRSERTSSTMVSRKVARRFFKDGDLFPETMGDADTYLFSSNFHHQLKAELLQDKISLQLALESTLHDRKLVSAQPKRQRGLQDEATVHGILRRPCISKQVKNHGVSEMSARGFVTLVSFSKTMKHQQARERPAALPRCS